MKKTIFINTLILFGAVAVNYKRRRELDFCRQKSDKALREMKLFEQWLFVKQDGKQISDYFQKKAINTVAIYGMGNIGERLYDELKDQNVIVKYAVDQKGKRVCSEIEVHPGVDIGRMEKVDAVVVTTVHCFEEVKKNISEMTDIPVLSLEEILYEM